jgi:hypothetical protein
MLMSTKLTGKAARWIQLAEEFGHLTGDDIDRLLVGAAELSPTAADATVSRPAPIDEHLLRRAAAIMLFGNLDDSPALEEDWTLLFS